jgi:hypothetical protein
MSAISNARDASGGGFACRQSLPLPHTVAEGGEQSVGCGVSHAAGNLLKREGRWPAPGHAKRGRGALFQTQGGLPAAVLLGWTSCTPKRETIWQKDMYEVRQSAGAS